MCFLWVNSGKPAHPSPTPLRPYCKAIGKTSRMTNGSVKCLSNFILDPTVVPDRHPNIRRDQNRNTNYLIFEDSQGEGGCVRQCTTVMDPNETRFLSNGQKRIVFEVRRRLQKVNTTSPCVIDSIDITYIHSSSVLGPDQPGHGCLQLLPRRAVRLSCHTFQKALISQCRTSCLVYGWKFTQYTVLSFSRQSGIL